MRIVDDGSPAHTCWSFVLAMITSVSLELIRRKDGSIVTISKISEVIVSNYSSLML